MHRDAPVGRPRPFGLRPVAVQLDAVAVRVPQVDRLADAVVGCSLDGHAGLEHAAQGPGERLAVRIEDREVIQARGPGGGRRRPTAGPRDEPDEVMVAARREKQGVPPVATRYPEAASGTVDAEGAL